MNMMIVDAYKDALNEETVMIDRRVSRTKRSIKEAFVDLLGEKGIDSFSINELCERADVNRGTFYNHFKDKEDLLNAIQSDFLFGLIEFKEQMGSISLSDLALQKITKRPFPQLVSLFEYLKDQSGFLSVMLGANGDPRFGKLLKEILCKEIVLSLLHDRYTKDPTPFVNYYVSFYSSAYLGVITEWIEGGLKESSEEMAQIAVRLLMIKPGESIVL